jgi:hypothetical protein
MQHDIQKPKSREQVSAQTPAKKRMAKSRWMVAGGAVVLVILGALAYGYFDAKNQLNKLEDPQAAAQAEAESLAKEIGHFLELPQGETPTVATVTDASKLKEQLFFGSAQNGDRVLIYAKAQKAVLYRPSSKKVVEYAPVSLGQ